MKDISSVKRNQEEIPNERIVNKIQDIVWDDVFEQYFLHPQVIIFSIIKRIGATTATTPTTLRGAQKLSKLFLCLYE